MRNKRSELTRKFGLKIKIERTKRHLSQDYLAELAGLNIKTISAIENGLSARSIETANDIAKALNIPLKELIDIENVTL